MTTEITTSLEVPEAPYKVEIEVSHWDIDEEYLTQMCEAKQFVEIKTKSGDRVCGLVIAVKEAPDKSGMIFFFMYFGSRVIHHLYKADRGDVPSGFLKQD